MESANEGGSVIQVMVFGAKGSCSCSSLFPMALSLEEPLYWLNRTYWGRALLALEIMGKLVV